MTLFHYLDFEPSLAADGWVATQTGDGTAVRGSTGWPDRGTQALRATGGSAGANVGYVTKSELGITNLDWEADTSMYVGAWIKNAANPAAIATIMRIERDANLFGSDMIAQVNLQTDGTLKAEMVDDAAASVISAATSLALTAGQWHWVVFEVHRAAGAATNDGYGKIYIDGHLRLTTANIDNFDRADNIDNILAGIVVGASNGHIIDIDEIKIADEYTEPTTATPADEYPSAQRTLVLYREASSDSKEFADYCVTTLGVPIGNLVPLPNAGASETLPNYVVFQTQIETDLLAWLALNPVIAAQATCFLVGYGVPGYFNSGTASTTSRLMNFGQTYAGKPEENTHYKSTTRLTKATLGSGEWMATRIDADTLTNAKSIVDAAVAVTALAELTDTDTLYTDDTDYSASLEFQHLRIVSSSIGTFSNDAFVFGDAGTPSYGPVGSRAVFIDTSTISANTLRSAAGSTCAGALITAGYSGAMGTAALTGNFDPTTFFEVLRLGYTYGEASMLASQITNSGEVHAGSPLLTTAFQADGYNLYRGVPNVDYDTVVGYFRAGVAAGTTIFSPDASTSYKYGLRAVYQGIETPGVDAEVDFTTDSGGDWIGNRPDAPIDVQLFLDSAGVLTIGWSYLTGLTAAFDFAIWHDPAVEPDGTQAADATPVWVSDGPYTQDFTLTDGLAYFFRIVARTAGGVESNPVIVGPLLADSTAPAAPAMVNTQTF